jgi:hypothetical protein
VVGDPNDITDKSTETTMMGTDKEQFFMERTLPELPFKARNNVLGGDEVAKQRSDFHRSCSARR